MSRAKLGPQVHRFSPIERAVANYLHEGESAFGACDVYSVAKVDRALEAMQERGLVACVGADEWELSPSGLNLYCDASCASPNCPRRKTR